MLKIGIVYFVYENAMLRDLETDLEYRIIAVDGTIHWLRDRGRLFRMSRETEQDGRE
jgi:hypothetical protein